jgi:hypothetical protein
MNMVLKFNRKTLWVCVFAIVIFAIVIAVSLRAEDITGNWQGTITPPQGNPRRMILQVIRDDSGALKARIYSIDQHVVRLPNANHYVFRSNEAEVIRAMNDFLDELPQP